MYAAVRLEADDRAGLERLLRYCARPAFASERLAWGDPDQPIRYALPKPLPRGQTELTLAPLEPLDRHAAIGITTVGCSPRMRAGVPMSRPAPDSP